MSHVPIMAPVPPPIPPMRELIFRLALRRLPHLGQVIAFQLANSTYFWNGIRLPHTGHSAN